MGAALAYSSPTLEEHFVFRGEMERLPRVILPFHRLAFAKITAWALGSLPDGKRNLALCMPPGHGKTFMAHDTVTWLTGQIPDSKWIYSSYAAELAEEQTMAIRDIMLSDWYRRVYPCARLKRGKLRQDRFDTIHHGSIYGVGLGGPITGFRAGRKRLEFGGGIIIDDPIKPGDARSKAKRETSNRWFTETLLSRRNHDTTPILIIMQRVHLEDLVGHVTATMPGLWDALTIPALDEATNQTIWPDTFSPETAAILKEVDPGTFYAQYQQSPMIPGGNIIKLHWWQTFNPNQGRRGGLIFLTADTAYKAKDDADASVIRAWEGTREHLYCLDAVYGRWEFPRLLQEAKAFWEKWSQQGAREFWIEDKASGTPLEQTLYENGVPAQAWKPSDFNYPDDKVSRMQEAAWPVHGGMVLVPEGGEKINVGDNRQLSVAHHAKVLMEECAAFSHDDSHAHDDHCDTLTMAVSVWRDAGGGKR